jgi:hypothetical protein
MTRSLSRPRYADVVGTLALVVAMSGMAYAAHALPKNSVGPKQLKTGAVTSVDVKDGTLGAGDLGAGSVGGAQLQPGSVASSNLAAASVGGAQLQPGSVGASHLQSGSVGTSSLQPGAVVTNDLANNAVTGAKITDGSVAIADLSAISAFFGVTGSVSANTCFNEDVAVAGAAVDDLVVVNLTTSGAQKLTFSPGYVSAPGQVTFRICNPTGVDITMSALGFRLLVLR